MTNPWTSIEFTPEAHPHATVYGFVIDHVWANQGVNAARRPHWPKGMFISVQPCEDIDEETEENLNIGAMKAWVFFDDDTEYGSPDDDLVATDWLIGELEDEAECLA